MSRNSIKKSRKILAKPLEEDRHESNLEFGIEKSEMNWNWKLERDFIGKMELITVDCVAMERIRAETL